MGEKRGGWLKKHVRIDFCYSTVSSENPPLNDCLRKLSHKNSASRLERLDASTSNFHIIFPLPFVGLNRYSSGYLMATILTLVSKEDDKSQMKYHPPSPTFPFLVIQSSSFILLTTCL